MKVAIIEGKRPSLMPEGPEIEKQILGADADIKCYGLLCPEEYKPALEELDAVITRPGTFFSKDMVRLLKKAKVIVSIGVGYDHIDLEAAKEKNIPVCNVPDYGTEEVADSAVAMLLAHQRKIFLFNNYVNSNPIDWDWRIHIPVSRSNVMRIGIVGLGRIGTAVALRLKPFGYKIAFYDPYLPRGVEKSLGLIRFHKAGDLLSSSDIVTLHTPLTQETAGMVDDKFLELMKPSAVLINTARGGIFKSADILLKFLKERPEFRIGSDVWPEEPPENHLLLQAWKNREAWLGDRLILTPHSAFYSRESAREIRAFAAEIVKTVLRGDKPYNVVNGVYL
ncbi:MAG: C-terminal binding protein [Candidatus Omnitrophota bacterium]